MERESFLVRPARQRRDIYIFDFPQKSREMGRGHTKKESDDDDDDREDAPNAVLLAMSVNSRRSGFVHFFTSRAESRTNSFRGAMAMSATSI